MRLLSPRLSVAFAALAVVSVAAAQSKWEKRLAPGLFYRQEVDAAAPLVVNAFRLSPGSMAIKMAAVLAKDKVFDETPDKGREQVSSMARRKGAIGGINGDFFQVPYTGDPLGTMVLDGELISSPLYPRSAFGWGDSDFQIAMPTWKGSVTVGDTSVALDGMNEAVGPDRADLQTPVCGVYTAKTPNITLTAKASGKAQPNGTLDLEVVKVSADVASGKPGDLYVLVATGTRAKDFAKVKEGDHLKVSLGVDGFDWGKIHNVIGGGPRLVHNGKVEVAWDTERFRDSFVNKRHPRSAVGITDSGELWFVTVDGRQKQSDGATLQELAEVMKRLGCQEAMNFDGGGSSDLATSVGPLNRPSDGGERPVANSIVFVETEKGRKKTAHTLSMRYPAKLEPNGKFNLSLVEGGVKVPNAEVLWMSAGDGWVDQGGTVRASESGSVKVIGYARGTRIETVIPVGPSATVKAPAKAAGKPATKPNKDRSKPTTTDDD